MARAKLRMVLLVLQPKERGPYLLLEREIDGRVWESEIGPDDRLTFSEFAAALGISVQALHKLHKTGKLHTLTPPKGQRPQKLRVGVGELKRCLIERGRYSAADLNAALRRPNAAQRVKDRSDLRQMRQAARRFGGEPVQNRKK